MFMNTPKKLGSFVEEKITILFYLALGGWTSLLLQENKYVK